MVINPYADQIEFPAGTPASIINAVMAIRARKDAMDAQPEWWETGINNVLNSANSQLIMPWLQNEFVNEPFTEFKTDQDIRKRQAEINAMQASELAQKQWLEEQATRQSQQLGQAQGGYLNVANTPIPTESTMGGGVNPYGAYEDPWSTGIYTPEDQQERAPTSQSIVDESGNVQEQEREPEGLTMPEDSGRANIFSSGQKPSVAEAMRLYAGMDPVGMGRLSQFWGKNSEVMKAMDPLQIEKTQAEIERKRAQTDKDRDLINRENALLEGRKRDFETKSSERESRVGLNQSRSQSEAAKYGLMMANAQTVQQKNDIRAMLISKIESGEWDDKDVQVFNAIASQGQMQPTPQERITQAAVAPRIAAEKPSIPEIIHLMAKLEAEEKAGTITPENQRLLDAYRANPKLQPPSKKGDDWLDRLMSPIVDQINAKRGGQTPRAPEGKTQPNTPPPPKAEEKDPYARLKRR